MCSNATPISGELCDEYEACEKALACHEESQRSSDAMRREYATLLLRVERELLRYLDEHPDGDESAKQLDQAGT